MKLPVLRVVKTSEGDDSPITSIDQVQEHEGTMVNSGFINGMDIILPLKNDGSYGRKGWGKRVVSYHLRLAHFSSTILGSSIPMIK
jgi:hypothetical protein